MTQLQKVASLVAQARKDNQREAIDKVAALVAEMRQEQEGLQKVAAKPLYGKPRSKRQAQYRKVQQARARAQASGPSNRMPIPDDLVPKKLIGGPGGSVVPQVKSTDIIDMVPAGRGRYMPQGSSNVPVKPFPVNGDAPGRPMKDVGGSSTVGSNQGGGNGGNGGGQGAQGGVPPAGKKSVMDRVKRFGALGGSYGVGLGTGLAIGASGDDKAAPAPVAPAKTTPAASAASASSAGKNTPSKNQSSFWDSSTNWIKQNPWTAVGGASLIAILLSLLAARGR